MISNKKGIIHILPLIIIGIILATGGWFTYKLFNPDYVDVFPKPTETPARQELEQDATVGESDWKTHEGEKIQYKFKYPNNWNISVTSGGILKFRNWIFDQNSDIQQIDPEEDFSFEVYEKEGATLQSRKNSIINNKDADYEFIGERKINNFEAHIYKFWCNQENKLSCVYEVSIETDQGLVLFSTYDFENQNFLSEFDQILSTFEFMK